MSEKIDKQIEKLVERSMKRQSLESPSSNFTAMVMKRVHALEKGTATVYKPLISKPMWFVIFVVTLLVIIYILFGLNNSETGLLDFIDLSILTNNKLSDALSGFEVSKTVLYSVVLFGVMLFIQVPILKRHFDSRFSV